MMLTKEKILELSKILKVFVEEQKVPMIRKKAAPVTNKTSQIQSNQMIIDDDNLDYAKLNLAPSSAAKGTTAPSKKKPAFNLYDIKNN